jgi:Domain of unknown function (DUF4956)
MDKLTVALLATFLAILIASGLLAYAFRDTSASPIAPAPAGVQTPTGDGSSIHSDSDSFLSQLFGSPTRTPTTDVSLGAVAARITLRFSLAALLAAFLAFRPRRGMTISQRNPYVAQTQILMAVVAAAMMMVVGDSAARAFGIFAAASLVRFRTNIRDPKEITVLLICLGVGLAAGVGRWDMALILSLFVLLTLAVLEHFEKSQVFRAMEISVVTKDVDKTNESLKRVFARHNLGAELRQLDHQDEDEPLGKAVYIVTLRAGISTDELSEEVLASDPENIDSVEWDQKKSSTYDYQ